MDDRREQADTMRDPRSRDDEDNLDGQLGAAVDAVRADEPSDETMRAAGERAWAAIEQAAGTVSDEAALEALIPAYVEGRLDPSQALLVTDRLREDAAFRAAVEAAREGRAPRRRPSDAPLAVPVLRPSRWRPAAWAVAAAVMLAVGMVGWGLGRDVLQPDRVLAHVESVDGGLYTVQDEGVRALDGDAAIVPNQRIRAGREGGALLRLADGSTVELAPRSELSVRSRWNGLALDLERGQVIVEAAEQGRGRLRVDTDDARVAVKGTIFSVRHGTKGSRVSVVEGAVDVTSGRNTRELLPGMQFSSSERVGSVPILQDVSWSRDAEEYRNLLAELRELGHEIEQIVERPEPRAASRLAALAPPDTVVFIGLPNLGPTFAESYALFRQRVSENEVLARWWAEQMDDPRTQARIDTLVAAVGRFGEQVGDEIAVVLTMDQDGKPGMPLVLAETVDQDGLRATLERELAELSALDEDSELPPVRIVEDPRAFIDGAAALDGQVSATEDARSDEGDALWVWLGDGIVAASPMPEALASLGTAMEAGAGPDPDFLRGIESSYADGIDALFAADLGAFLERGDATVGAMDGATDGDHGPTMDAGLLGSGMAGARFAFVTQVAHGERSDLRAELTFDGERQGVAGWLAEPAPMGALSYISPDATLVSAAVIRRPELVVAEMLSTLDDAGGLPAQDQDALLGAELIQELAAPLGGELAFALDGPILPEPSWKLLVEVFDEPALQRAIERTVERLNERIAAEEAERGEELPEQLRGRRLALSADERGGRTVWTLAADGADAIALHYAMVDGYLIATSNPALIGESVRVRDSGLDFTTTTAFQEALPAGDELDFSALAWHDLESLVGEAATLADDAAAARGAELDVASRLAPSLVVAWADDDSISLAGSTAHNPLGFSTLLGVGGMTLPTDAPATLWEGMEQPPAVAPLEPGLPVEPAEPIAPASDGS